MKAPVGLIVMAAWISLSMQEETTATPATETTATTATTPAATGTATTAAPTGTATTAAPTGAATTATPAVTITTSAPVDPNQRPVGVNCSMAYSSCKRTTTPPGYCAAYTTARSCIVDSNNCNVSENATLKFFDCGPQEFYNITISNACLDRVTECLAQSYAGKAAPVTLDFKTVFCASDSKGDCIKKESGSSKCTANEVTVAVKLACSAPQALLSSALFISLAFMLQRLLKDY